MITLPATMVQDSVADAILGLGALFWIFLLVLALLWFLLPIAVFQISSHTLRMRNNITEIADGIRQLNKNVADLARALHETRG